MWENESPYVKKLILYMENHHLLSENARKKAKNEEKSKFQLSAVSMPPDPPLRFCSSMVCLALGIQVFHQHRVKCII